MTPEQLQNFKSEIARIVHPITAARAHKRRIEEELLAHVTALYTDELERSHDPIAAARAALQRFGNAHELTIQLQASVSPLEKFLALVIHPKEHQMKFVLWFAAIAAIFIGPGLVLPALAKFKALGGSIPRDSMMQFVLCLTMGAVITLAGVIAVVYAILSTIKRSPTRPA